MPDIAQFANVATVALIAGFFAGLGWCTADWITRARNRDTNRLSASVDAPTTGSRTTPPPRPPK